MDDNIPPLPTPATDLNALAPIEVGFGNTASGAYASAMGYENSASGCRSNAFGSNNAAQGDFSSAFGYCTQASSYLSAAYGSNVHNGTQCSTEIGFGDNDKLNISTGGVQVTSTNGVFNISSACGVAGYYLNGCNFVAIQANCLAPIQVGFGNNALNIASQGACLNSAMGYCNTASGYSCNNSFGYCNNVVGRFLNSAFGSCNTVCGSSTSCSETFGRNNTMSGYNSASFGNNLNTSNSNFVEIGTSDTSKAQISNACFNFIGNGYYLNGAPISSPSGVSSVGLTSSGNTITISGTNPITSTGTFDIEMNQVNLAASGSGGVGGNLPVGNLNSGSGASSSTFWRGDNSWAAPTFAGVTSVDIYSPNSTISTGGGPVTSFGSFTVDLQTQVGLSPGSYSNMNATVDAYGRITTASNGSFSSGTVTSVALSSPGGSLSIGGTNPITGSGTISVDLASNNISQFTNNSGYLSTLSGQNISQLTNDSGYLTPSTGLTPNSISGSFTDFFGATHNYVNGQITS